MKINDEKKSAIKLINQYAERFKRLDLENKELLNEIDDLKKNLKLSKEIIDSFFKSEQKEKSKVFLKNTKEEIKNLNISIDNLRKDLKESRDKNTYYEIIMNESILKHKNNTEDLENKIFILENLIKKKDAVICYLNLKLNSLYESIYLCNIYNELNSKEVYLLEPSTSVMLAYSELSEVKKNYKEECEKLDDAIEKIERLKIENEELKKKIDNISESSEDIIKDDNMKKENKTITIDLKQKNFENEEWLMILKKAKISKETMINFQNTKIEESIEILVKMIMEKNMQIRVLYHENENLNERNTILYNEICEYKKAVTNYKKELKLLQTQLSDKSQIDKSQFEASLNLEKKLQYKNYEKYLDEFNTTTQRIDDTLLQDEIKECYKSFMTNDSTINKKPVLTMNQIESFISTMRKSDNLFDKSVSNIDNK